MSALTMDNASVCDAMARYVAKFLKQKYDIEFKCDNGRIHCFAHALNLTVQAFLSGLGDAEDPEEVDHFALHKHEARYLTEADLEEQAEGGSSADKDGEEPEDSLMAELEEALLMLETEIGTNNRDAAKSRGASGIDPGAIVTAIGKVRIRRLEPKLIFTLAHRWHFQIRTVTTKIRSSPQRRAKFQKYAMERYSKTVAKSKQDKERAGTVACANPETEKASLMPIPDVRTRWNSTFLMLRRAVQLKEAINDWTYNEDKFRDCLRLSLEDWQMMEDVIVALEVS